MSSEKQADGDLAPIENLDELSAFLADGCKPKSDWRIGTEHEKFVYCRETLMPAGYDGPNGIRAI
ncbi:MAG: glutamate--cysteine ligase, partial [Parvularculaceae bacterium]|nr:glutamate--cysteine ligase [Parvularculaceae bacterium]